MAVALRAERSVYGDAEILAVARALCADLIGAGPLEPLLAEPDVTDVLVNGPREVWVDDGARPAQHVGARFTDDGAVRRLAQRLAAAAGRRLDDASPVRGRPPGRRRPPARRPATHRLRRHLRVAAAAAPTHVHARDLVGRGHDPPPVVADC